MFSLDGVQPLQWAARSVWPGRTPLGIVPASAMTGCDRGCVKKRHARRRIAAMSNSRERMTSLALDPVDLTDPASFPDGPPHAFLARLRAEAPVWWHPDGLRRNGFWVVTRYDDVRAILLQPTVFVNAQGHHDRAGGAGRPRRFGGRTGPGSAVLHRPSAARPAAQGARAALHALADPGPGAAGARPCRSPRPAAGGRRRRRFRHRGRRPLSARVLAAVLGLPEETEAALHRFVGALGDAKSGGEAPGVDDPARAAATIEFLTAVHELATARLANPARISSRRWSPAPVKGPPWRPSASAASSSSLPSPGKRRPAAPAGSACRCCWSTRSSGRRSTADPVARLRRGRGDSALPPARAVHPPHGRRRGAR